MKKTYEEIVKEVDKDFESYTLEDMEAYGYKHIPANKMLPISDDFAKELYCYEVEIYRLYSDDTEGLVESMEEINSHIKCGGMFGIESETWDSVKDKLDELKDSFIHTIEVKKDFMEKISLDEFEVYNKLTALVDLTDENALDLAEQPVIPPPSRGRSI